jgi:hypothetical protein
MSLRRGLLRVIVMLWAVLQLGAPAIAASADADATLAAAGARAHVEGGATSSCIRIHDTECVFCQYLAVGASPAAGRAHELPAIAQVAAPAPELGAPHRVSLRGIAIPRAPPLA